MAKRPKYIKPPDPTMHEMIRNMIRTTSRTYRGGDYETDMDSIYFMMWGKDKELVNDEIRKWVDVQELTDKTKIVLPERFFK
ncbi:MAG: hypothetical protein EOP48_15590 [Sphingobacteriales bacterium]|nr:MAG: hypothetical protein EOP48_15590 [Sphingobacteriales bacterium]